MAVTVERAHRWALHPLHAVVLAGTVPLFLGALLSDLAYWCSYEIQWSNFASWLIVGGLVPALIVVLWALVQLVRADDRRGRSLSYFLVVLLMWVLGFVDALVHAQDAWAAMPGGLVLSTVVAVLACAATWLGFSGARTGAAP